MELTDKSAVSENKKHLFEELQIQQNVECNFSPFAYTLMNIGTSGNQISNSDEEHLTDEAWVLEDEGEYNLEEHAHKLVEEGTTEEQDIDLRDSSNNSESFIGECSLKTSPLTSTKDSEEIEEGPSCLVEEINISEEEINILKNKLEEHREQRDLFKSLEMNFNILCEVLPKEVGSGKYNVQPDVKKDTTKTEYNGSLKKEVMRLNKLSESLTQVLSKVQLQLETRNKQLDKAVELMNMMKKGLSDRGTYIKLLIEDNKKLREEVKFGMRERKSLWERFIIGDETLELLEVPDGTDAVDFE